MHRHIAILAAALPLLLATAARADTLLQLSDTETVSIVPDELTASLRAEASSQNPADAQQRVNAAMADALAQARKQQGITISTGSYAVWHVGATPQAPRQHWQASQTLELTGHHSGPLLRLVGALQHAGLAINALDWRLSRQAERTAHAKAMRLAIAALRGKAEQAASLLGLRFASFKEVRLGAPAQPPVPRFVGAVSMMAAQAQPNAVAANVPVSATVQADAILTAK